MKARIISVMVLGIACGAMDFHRPAKAAPSCGPRVHVTFDAGFPDRFTIENLSPDGWIIEQLAIDLGETYGEVVFDIVPGSVSKHSPESFYLVEKLENEVRLRSKAPVLAAKKSMMLVFDAFPANGKMSFSIDLDDTSRISSRGRHRVTFGEMAGAKVTAFMRGNKGYGAQLDAVFGQFGSADTLSPLLAPGCV